MARVKRSVAQHKRHKRTIKAAKGAWGRRSKLFRRAKETVIRAMAFSTRDRMVRRREFRTLWISRIRAACKNNGVAYNTFIHKLKLANVDLDRKILSDLAVSDPDAFKTLTDLAKTDPEKAAA